MVSPYPTELYFAGSGVAVNCARRLERRTLAHLGVVAALKWPDRRPRSDTSRLPHTFDLADDRHHHRSGVRHHFASWPRTMQKLPFAAASFAAVDFQPYRSRAKLADRSDSSRLNLRDGKSGRLCSRND